VRNALQNAGFELLCLDSEDSPHRQRDPSVCRYTNVNSTLYYCIAPDIDLRHRQAASFFSSPPPFPLPPPHPPPPPRQHQLDALTASLEIRDRRSWYMGKASRGSSHLWTVRYGSKLAAVLGIASKRLVSSFGVLFFALARPAANMRR
jgi:hypothetical protein